MNFYKPLPLIALLVLSMLAQGCASAETLHEETGWGKNKRTYTVHVPEAYREDSPAPLVFVFHGGGGSAGQVARSSGFNKLSEEHGFIAVYPQGVNKHWNDGRDSEKFKDQDAKIDDIAWIEKILATLKQKYAIDADRVYAVGISNGGMFTQRLAIESGRNFAAAASLTAQIPEPLAQATAQSPVSMLMINGTDDPVVPYHGGEVAIHLFPRLEKLRPQPSRGRVISTEDTVRFWMLRNDVGAKETLTELPDTDPGDGATAQRLEWTNHGNNASVVLYKIIGGGHTWPGTQSRLPVRVVGATCQDFNASEAIWAFFAAHPRVSADAGPIDHADTDAR